MSDEMHVMGMVRVIETSDPHKALLAIGPVAVEGDRREIEHRSKLLRSWLERQLLGAYCRYSVELRDRLHWRSGAGAAETKEQIVQMAVDLEEVRWDNITHKQRIETLESEIISTRGMFGVKVQELNATRKELLTLREMCLNYERVLQVIATSSSDTASRMSAEGVLYRGGAL